MNYLFLVLITSMLVRIGDGVLFEDTAPPAPQCGRPAIEPVVHRIVGGTPARPGSWPWMVALLEQTGNGFRIACGGSLLAPNVVLTAAHCFDSMYAIDPARWRAIVGKYNLKKSEMKESTHSVRKIVLHESYNDVTIANDIALVILENPVTYSDYVSTICLPGNTTTAHIGQVCYITGFGETRGGNETVLNQVAVPILSDALCARRDWYGTDFKGETTFCAGYARGRKDACKGDSGGPLMCRIGNTWYQEGIISWGYDCGRPRWPGIYTDVPLYVDWTKRVARENGHQLPTSVPVG